MDIKLFGINGLATTVKAKVDTGAFSSSVDKKLLEDLGFHEPLKILNDPEFITEQLSLQYQNRGEVSKVNREKILLKYPSVKSIGRVFSSNGMRLTPFFELDVELENQRFKTVFNLSDRKKMEYDIILGRKALRNFLIDVDKDFSKHIKKFTK